MHRILLLAFGIAFSTCANAQLNDLTKGLKSLADKVKQQSTQKQSESGANQSSTKQSSEVDQKPPKNGDSGSEKAASHNSAQNTNETAQKTPKVGEQSTDPIELVKSFRAFWCKSIDTSNSGPIDYKGIKPGDLCQLPDEIIISLEQRLKSEKLPYQWISQPSSMTEGTGIVLKDFRAGDKSFFAFAVIVDPTITKAYLGSFTVLVCAADKTNSLNADNPFRRALEAKYGPPTFAYTEYEDLKAQIDALDADIERQKSQAITVKEAKSARDNGAAVKQLKAMLPASDKKAILSLTWEYDKGNKTRTNYSTTVKRADPGSINMVGGCPVLADLGAPHPQPLGFALGVGPTKSIIAIGEAIDAKNSAKEKEKVRNAPAPKL